MDPQKLFFDDRLKGVCIYCGLSADTRDHVPSRILLDRPYPNNMSVVPACNYCNNRFSLDEAYLACVIDCAQSGGIAEVKRKKVKDLLNSNIGLALKIHTQSARSVGEFNLVPDIDRVKNVIIKIARGHIYYECAEILLYEPSYLMVKTFASMEAVEIEEYEMERGICILPEIGSRAFARFFSAQKGDVAHEWEMVQAGRYRYVVNYSGMSVKLVLSEYLACEVIWS